MHWLDALYLKLPRVGLFSAGWGDWERVLEAAQPYALPSEQAPLPIRWSMPTISGGIEHRLGTAKSPAPLIGEDLEELEVLRLTPVGRPVRARCIVPPSWGDQGFRERTLMLSALVSEGFELWFLEGAFFGGRRPTGQQGVGLRTVAELLQMGLCNLTELRGLVSAARDAQPSAPVILVGFSMAGTFAAQAAATLPWDIPVVAMAPSDSAVAVFCEGPFSKTVVWSALGGNRTRLEEVLAQFGITVLAPPPTQRRFLLATRHDGIVPPSAMERVAAHWKVAPRWVESGHLGGFFFHRRAMHRAIRESLEDSS